MATVDPKKQALVRALMERDLYEMLDVPRDADDAFAARLFAGGVKPGAPVGVRGPLGDFVLADGARVEPSAVVVATR